MKRTMLGMFLRVSLLMLAAGGMQGQSSKHKAATSLEKTEWKLTWLGGTKIEAAGPQQEPYLQLDPESHRVSGSGGCNRMMGAYQVEGNHLKFTQMAMTRMACIHGGETESAFSKALDEVAGWKIAGGKLWLLDANQRVVAKFSAYQPES